MQRVNTDTESHPRKDGRGGKRAGAGRKRDDDALRHGHNLHLRLSRQQTAFVSSLSAARRLSAQEVIRSFLISCMEGDIPLPSVLTGIPESRHES